MNELPPNVREVILKLEQGLRELYGDRYRGLLLYGSYARGEARERITELIERGWEFLDIASRYLKELPVAAEGGEGGEG